MKKTPNLEIHVLQAARDLAQAWRNKRSLKTALFAFYAATNNLPVRRMGAWERALNHELHRVLGSELISRIRLLPLRRQTTVPWLDLVCGNGFRREHALQTITGAAPNAFLLSLLIRRLNDWVPQVRAAAVEAVSRVAAETPPDVVADVLWATLPNISKWGRFGILDKNAMLDLLTIPGVSHALGHKLRDTASGPGATVLRQASRRQTIDDWLEELASNAAQPAVRAVACRFLLTGKANWLEGREWRWTDKRYCKGEYTPVLGERAINISQSPQTVLSTIMNDKSAYVRRLAGDYLIENRMAAGAELHPIAEKLAQDEKSSVADRGRWLLDRGDSRSEAEKLV